MKKLGVVVPIYNAEAYLEQCIESIINQTYYDIDIVLVDDGSTDNSGIICDGYAKKDKRIRVLHQHNQGVSHARYSGLKQLDSEYATFIDADDWIKCDTYETMARYMDEGIEVIYFSVIVYHNPSFEYILENNYPAGSYNAHTIRQKIFPSLIWNIGKEDFGFNPSLCNKIIKKELLMEQLETVCNLPCNCVEDGAVIYPLMMRVKSMVLIEAASYYYRQRKPQEVAGYITNWDFYKNLLSFYDYMLKKIEGQEEFVKQLDFLFANLAKLHLRKYENKLSRKSYLFPYNIIPVNKKIILYGAGTVGQSYYKQLKQLDYADIVAWVDKDSERYLELGVSRIECIEDIPQYDYIVIAVNNFEVADVIRQNLIMTMNVDKEKIIWSCN